MDYNIIVNYPKWINYNNINETRGGEKMQTVIIIVLVVIIYLLWRKYMKYKSALAAYLRYFEEQGMKEPTAETIRKYQRWAVEMMVKDFFKSR